MSHELDVMAILGYIWSWWQTLVYFNHLSYDLDVVMAIRGCFIGLDDRLWYTSMKVTKSFIKGEGVRVFCANVPLEIPMFLLWRDGHTGIFFKITIAFIKGDGVRVFGATVLFEILLFQILKWNFTLLRNHDAFTHSLAAVSKILIKRLM